MVIKLENNMLKEIDLMRNAVYVVCKGMLKEVDCPPSGFGKQEITWQDGKPVHSEIKYTQKF